MAQHCEACGSEYVDGEHPNQECGQKQWAACTNRLLKRISDLLTSRTDPPKPSAAPAKAGSEHGSTSQTKGV